MLVVLQNLVTLVTDCTIVAAPIGHYRDYPVNTGAPSTPTSMPAIPTSTPACTGPVTPVVILPARPKGRGATRLTLNYDGISVTSPYAVSLRRLKDNASQISYICINVEMNLNSCVFVCVERKNKSGIVFLLGVPG